MKKKSLILTIVLLFLFLYAGCGNIEGNVQHGSIRKDLSSIELTQLMGNGINLGNTMEAYGRSTLGTDADVSAYETFWGQPVTTQEILTDLKASGFDSLRIPVAWTNMMNFEDGDYTINSAYLDRVEEIVTYALNADMYVVINDHWDGGWWGKFGSASEETRKSAMELYKSMWQQIAERFKNYSDYVIFESANEEVGNRLNDLDLCPDSGTLSQDECYEMSLVINQAFVDTVRKTGGNNKDRFLLIAGYNTDINCTIDPRFQMPTDSADDKLLISVHYYEPSGYCINNSLSSWGNTADVEDMNNALAKMTAYTARGIGVIIGEYAVTLNEKGEVKEDSYPYLKNFLDNCDYYGYCPMLWDCSSHYKRTELDFLDDDIESLYAGRNYTTEASLDDNARQEKAQLALDDNMTLAAENNVAPFVLDPNKSVAWIMYNSSDWNCIYSVGDQYDTTSMTGGIIATDVEINGEGTYTVALDFTGTSAGSATGIGFTALGIANGESLYPGYIITLKEVKINGETMPLKGRPYTTSDDGLCTRVNLYNEWVTQINNARTIDGSQMYLSACVLDRDSISTVNTMEVTFMFSKGK